VVDETLNTSSRVEFTVYNEQGYQFTVATQRPHWVSWISPFRVDPVRLTLHKMDRLDPSVGSVYIRTKYLQVGRCPGLLGCCRICVLWSLLPYCRVTPILPGDSHTAG
jgi:hypothetical protein